MNSIKPIVRIFVAAVIMLATYQVILAVWEPQVNRGQHQWQDNVMTAQRYIYASSQLPVVVTGSSLSTRLLELPPDYFNLALGGSDALTGLEIVLKREHLPRIVLIETNVLRSVDSRFISKLYAPPLYQLKEYLLPLREEYQPFNVFASFWWRRALKPRAANAERKREVPREVLQIQIDKVTAPVDDAFRSRLARNLDRLIGLVQSLASKSVVPVFYRMPLHPEVTAACRTRFERLACLEKFPRSRYYWIPDPQSTFRTTDGLHLGRSEALEYCLFFVSKVESIRKEIAGTSLKTPRFSRLRQSKTGSK